MDNYNIENRQPNPKASTANSLMGNEIFSFFQFFVSSVAQKLNLLVLSYWNYKLSGPINGLMKYFNYNLEFNFRELYEKIGIY